MSQNCDFLVIGAGMAGASVAYHLAEQGSVLVLEQEPQPGYHSTGRSAALYSETYGNAAIRALTTGSGPFYRNPPDGFAEYPLIQPRGVYWIAREDQLDTLQKTYDEIQKLCSTLRKLGPAEAFERVPVLRPDYVAGVVEEPDAQDLDVDGIHQGFLRGLRQRGGSVITEAEVQSGAFQDGVWSIEAESGRYTTPVVVNAAGAWGDVVAKRCGIAPVGLVPKRRTAMLFSPPEGMSSRNWPLFVDVDEQFYVKPEVEHLLGSPADETPSEPCDARPEDWDLAVAAERIGQATTLEIERISRKWAGLRTFVADKTPVVGYAPAHEGFFWLVGPGGYGIQTAPALSRTAAVLVLGHPVPDDLTAFGVQADALSPERLMIP
ncbi:MAG TPA: FAD-binding oxidoreductase [Deltaproteobacteria bacterium]|nr:FAD-binding oxidoreductase [Deltaproteobacteria bacterium]